MFVLRNVTHWTRDSRAQGRPVLRDVSAVLPSDQRFAVLCASPDARRALMDLLSGLERPMEGEVEILADVSWPVGRPLGLTPDHSLRRNCAFAARIHGVDPVDLLAFVGQFVDLDRYGAKTLRRLPSAVAATFRYALAYGLPFETYLIEGPIAPREAADNALIAQAAERVVARAGLLLCTGSLPLARRLCTEVAVLHEGRLEPFPGLEEAAVAFAAARGVEEEPSPSLPWKVAAERALKAGDLPRAEAAAGEELAENPESASALFVLSQVAGARGDQDAQVALLTEACGADPNHAEAWKALAKLAGAERKPERLRSFARVCLDHPDADKRRTGARILEKLGDPDEIASAWVAVIEREPGDVDTLLEVAERTARLDMHAFALSVARRARAVDPWSARALVVSVRCEQALELHDDLVESLVMLAYLRPVEGVRYAKALRRAGREADARRVDEVVRERTAAAVAEPAS